MSFQETKLKEIADAIRAKKGTTEPIKATDFASEIESIQNSGGEDMMQMRVDSIASCRYLMGYYSGDNVDFLANLNTSNVTDMSSMFSNCTNLTTIPVLNTSNVTNMNSMFMTCSELTTVPQLDTSKVTTMSYMFSGCTNLTTIPVLNTSNVTNMSYMFSSCRKLTTVPQLDTSNVTNMNYMFNTCNSLTTIPALDVSNVTNMNYIFGNDSNLKSILMYGMKVSFSITNSNKFEREDLVTILNNLATVTSSQTLTMGNTNLAKLTEEDKAIATLKGWTLA